MLCAETTTNSSPRNGLGQQCSTNRRTWTNRHVTLFPIGRCGSSIGPNRSWRTSRNPRISDSPTPSSRPFQPPSTHNGGRNQGPQCEDPFKQVCRLLLLDPYVIPRSRWFFLFPWVRARARPELLRRTGTGAHGVVAAARLTMLLLDGMEVQWRLIADGMQISGAPRVTLVSRSLRLRT